MTKKILPVTFLWGANVPRTSLFCLFQNFLVVFPQTHVMCLDDHIMKVLLLLS